MIHTETEAWIGEERKRSKMLFDADGSQKLFIIAPDIEAVRQILIEDHMKNRTQKVEPVLFITRQKPLPP